MRAGERTDGKLANRATRSRKPSRNEMVKRQVETNPVLDCLHTAHSVMHLTLVLVCVSPPLAAWTYGDGHTINAIPLWFDLVPQDKVSQLVSWLVEDIQSVHQNHTTVGFIGN